YWQDVLRQPYLGESACREDMHRYFFFFQAEDGIRDYKVTGVQTCALPILVGAASLPLALALPNASGSDAAPTTLSGATVLVGNRSEERRVGKECRQRRSPGH